MLYFVTGAIILIKSKLKIFNSQKSHLQQTKWSLLIFQFVWQKFWQALDSFDNIIKSRHRPAFDDLYSITERVRKFEIEIGLKIWIHVDAAYGGPIFWLEEKRHLMRGVDKIDSFNANMSKVGLGGTDSSPMWVRNRFDLINSFSESTNDDENNDNPFPNQGKSWR